MDWYLFTCCTVVSKAASLVSTLWHLKRLWNKLDILCPGLKWTLLLLDSFLILDTKDASSFLFSSNCCFHMSALMIDARLSESSDTSEPDSGGGGSAPGEHSWSASGRVFRDTLLSISRCSDSGEVFGAGACFAPSSSLEISSADVDVIVVSGCMSSWKVKKFQEQKPHLMGNRFLMRVQSPWGHIRYPI